MPNSHRPPDNTRRSCLCRIRRCELSLDSRDRLAKSEQLADPRRVAFSRRSSGYVICSSPQRAYILGGVQRRCVSGGGATRRSCLPGVRRGGGGRQAGARRSSLVWLGGVDACNSLYCWLGAGGREALHIDVTQEHIYTGDKPPSHARLKTN